MFEYQKYDSKLQLPTGIRDVGLCVNSVTGDPTEEIVRLSNIYNADLIVIGSRGLKGINRILQGSISSQVVAEANCSVFVVKQR